MIYVTCAIGGALTLAAILLIAAYRQANRWRR